MPSLSQSAIPSPDVLFQNLEGEAVLLNLASETYFGLNSVGTRTWELLGQTPNLGEVFAQLQNEYEVDAAELESDLLALVDALAKAGLVQLR